MRYTKRINKTMTEIKYNASFEFILGKKREDYSEEERIKRWNIWKSAAKKSRKNYLLETWLDQSDCEKCVHLDKVEAWCKLMGLPCTVNPILSFREGIVGLACMGAGKELPNTQLELFKDPDLF
jgi:hypothetical protein